MIILSVVAIILFIWIAIDLKNMKMKEENCKQYLFIKWKGMLLGVILLLNLLNAYLLTH